MNAPFLDGLFQFLTVSPTPFHAVAEMRRQLEAAGFTELREGDAWKVAPLGKHFVIRNQSSIVAFRAGKDAVGQGARMIGTHTDSPCLKVKPKPEVETAGYLKLGVEAYGGILLSTWFDRDLSLAGRVSYLSRGAGIGTTLVDLKRPVAVIPNLAIHLNRDVNEMRAINKQTELPPVVQQGGADFRDLLKEALPEDAVRVLDWELSFYDVQKPAVVGWKNEFFTSARIDNLLSCYVALRALVDAGGDRFSLFVANDHEEVGSASSVGAEGPFLRSVLERVLGAGENFYRCMDKSVFVSADNAHGIHPNYPDKHDGNHGPILNKGPAIKINANQRYATTSETSSLFSHLCERAEVPSQRFVARTDMACGSTIGPITATALGVKVVDIGVPTWAMHSARETAGVKDAESLHRVLKLFLTE